MSYVVNWRGNDGQAGWHPVADLEEAAAHVERLRNVEGVNETKIFALEEVAFEFRPYYRVELAASTAPEPGAVSFAASLAPEPAAPAPPAPVAVEADAPGTPAWPVADDAGPQVADDAVDVTAEPAADEAGANGARRGLFGR